MPSDKSNSSRASIIYNIIGIIKVTGFWPKNITPKLAWYLYSDSCIVLVWHSQAKKCLRINPKPFHQRLISYLMDFFTDWRTDWLTYSSFNARQKSQRQFSYYFLLTMLWNEFDIAKIEALWLSHMEIWGTQCILRIFFNGWMDYRDAFHACSLLVLLCNGQNVDEYEACWLVGIPIINLWGVHQPFFLMHGLTNHS